VAANVLMILFCFDGEFKKMRVVGKQRSKNNNRAALYKRHHHFTF